MLLWKQSFDRQFLQKIENLFLTEEKLLFLLQRSCSYQCFFIGFDYFSLNFGTFLNFFWKSKKTDLRWLPFGNDNVNTTSNCGRQRRHCCTYYLSSKPHCHPGPKTHKKAGLDRVKGRCFHANHLSSHQTYNSHADLKRFNFYY